MGEQAQLLAGAVFLVLLSVTMVRLGRFIGGAAWSWAWLFLYGSGLAATLSTEYPILSPAVPALGTAFATFFLGGVLLFSGRCQRFPKPLLMLGLGIASVRIAILSLVGAGASQAFGSLVISAAALASSWVLLRPPGRVASYWEQTLGLCVPAIAVASVFNAASWLFEISAPPTARYWWLLVAISIGVLQVSAIISHAAERFKALRSEADRSRDAHASAEERYRDITEQASDMISEVDEHGMILYANPIHETILGFKPANLIGQPVTVLFPDAQPTDPDSAFSDMFSMRPHLRIVSMLRRDGEARTLECSLRPFSLASGERRMVIMTRDVTERVAVERAREENREELETLVEERTVALESSLQELERSERLASIGTLAAGIAHQINNPIGSIQMSSEFALDSEGAENERDVWRGALRNCVEQAQRCGRIVSSMLQFARNEPTVKSEEDLAAILRQICEQTDDYARNQMATINTRGIEGPLPIFGSAIELEQALLNIVRNATESSNEAVHVEVSAIRENGFARVTVSDDGGGMEALEVDRAFDPFFTTRLGHGGTGLGLSVAHGVAMDHGGLLSIESEKGVGTKLTLSIPLRAGPDSVASHASK